LKGAMTMSDFTKTKYSMSAETRAFFAREDVRAGVAEIRAQVSDAQFAITGSGAYAAVSVYSPTLNRGCYWSPSLGADNALKYLTGGRDSGWHAREDCAAGIREGRALADENGEPIGGVKSLGAATVMPLTVSSNEQAEELFGKGSVLSKPFKEEKPKPDPYAEHREKEEKWLARGNMHDPSGRNVLNDTDAKMLAENRALFGHVPARFSADVVPVSRESDVVHPWQCSGDDEP
jgi:hypothetical protein